MKAVITFGDLVTAVSDQVRSDSELAATVAYLVNSGRVRFRGELKDARFDLFCSPTHEPPLRKAA